MATAETHSKISFIRVVVKVYGYNNDVATADDVALDSIGATVTFNVVKLLASVGSINILAFVDVAVTLVSTNTTKEATNPTLKG
ncbi:hypothetical protein V6N13_010091 [Hibiscus sabdariffa]